MKIVAFGDGKYKRIAHNWALHLKRCRVENYTIYSLDRDIYNYLIENEVNTELVETNMFGCAGFSISSSIERFNYILKLLENDTPILHSDLDAVWLKNPLGFISDNHDIVSSIARFPNMVYEKIGYTLCMGWTYYKPCDVVKTLLKNAIHYYVVRPWDPKKSDQWALNVELFSPKNKLNTFNEKYSDLKLKVLGQSIVSRNEPHDENTYVVHPVIPQSIDPEEFLKTKNLWLLSD